MFVNQYVPQKSDDFSGSSMSGIHFSAGILAFTLKTHTLTRIEYIAIFEAEISIGDVFACTPFNMYGFSLRVSDRPRYQEKHLRPNSKYTTSTVQH